MDKPIKTLYADVARFLQLGDEQLDFILAAWCSYRSADGRLVELLVDHMHSIDHGYCRDMKRAYFTSQVERFGFITKHKLHVKALTLASCKYQHLNHPELVEVYLQMNSDITLPKLLDKIEENTGTKLKHKSEYKIPA